MLRFLLRFTVLILCLMPLGYGTLSAQPENLTAIETLLNQSQTFIENGDIATAVALVGSANILLADADIASCPALSGMRTLFEQISASTDATTISALLTASQTLLDSCAQNEMPPTGIPTVSLVQPDINMTSTAASAATAMIAATATANSNVTATIATTTTISSTAAPTPASTISSTAQFEFLSTVGRGIPGRYVLAKDFQNIVVGSNIGLWLYAISGTNDRLIETDYPVLAGDISSDGTLTAMLGAEGSVHLVDTISEQVNSVLTDVVNITAMTFSPTDPSLLLTANSIGDITLWRGDTPQIITTMNGRVIDIEFSADGSRIAAITSSVATVWEINGVQVNTFALLGTPMALALNSSGSLLATANTPQEGMTQVWDVDQGGEPVVFTRGNMVTDLVFSVDDQSLIAGTDGYEDEYQIASFSLDTGELITQGAIYDDVAYLAMLPSGILIHVVDMVGDGTIIELLNQNLYSSSHINPGFGARLLTFAPGGRTAVITGEMVTREYDILTGRALRIVKETQFWTANPHTLAFAGTALISDAFVSDYSSGAPSERYFYPYDAGANATPDGAYYMGYSSDTFAIYRMSDSSEVALLTQPGSIRSVNYTPTASHFLTVVENAPAYIYNLEAALQTGEPQTEIAVEGNVVSAAISSNARFAAMAINQDDVVRVELWDTATSTSIMTIETGIDQLSSEDVRRMVFSPAENRLIIELGGYQMPNRVLWIDTETSSIIHEEAYSDMLRNIVFSPDGTQAAIGGSGDRIQFWDVEAGTGGEELAYASPARAAQYSPDGAVLLTSSDADTRVWDVATGALLGQIDVGGAAYLNADGTIVGIVDSAQGLVHFYRLTLTS